MASKRKSQPRGKSAEDNATGDGSGQVHKEVPGRTKKPGRHRHPGSNSGTTKQGRGSLNSYSNVIAPSKPVASLERPEGYENLQQSKKRKNRHPKRKNKQALQPTSGTLPVSPSRQTPHTTSWFLLDKLPTMSPARVLFNDNRIWHFLVDSSERNAYWERQLTKYERNDVKKLGPIEANPDPNIMTALARWPHIPDTVTRAPFVLSSTHSFGNVANQNSKLLELLNTGDVLPRLLQFLPDHLDRAKFSATCIRVFELINQNSEHWDLTNGYFYGRDIEKPIRRLAADPTLSEERHPELGTLIVSPYRGTEMEVHNGKIWAKVPTFAQAMDNHHKMFCALDNFALFVTNLHLHRVTFLDVLAVKMIVNSLPRLEHVAIFQCPQLNFCKTAECMKIVGERGRKTGKHIEFDMFPTYHRGPIWETLSDGKLIGDKDGFSDPNAGRDPRLCSTGVSWEKLPFRTYLGVYAIFIYKMWPLHQKYGFDMLSTNKAFRLYMERLPLPMYSFARVVEALMTRDRPIDPCEAHLSPEDRKKRRHRRFARDVSAAITEEQITEEEFSQLGAEGKCEECDATMMILFYPHRNHVCYGCHLSSLLADETDHFKIQMAEVVERALMTQEPTIGPNGEIQKHYHETVAGIVAAKKAGPNEPSHKFIAQADRVVHFMDEVRAHHMAPGYSTSGKQHPKDPLRATLHTRLSRVHNPTGPVDRLRADIQRARVEECAARSLTNDEDYTTDGDAFALLTPEEKRGLPPSMRRRVLDEKRDEMRSGDKYDLQMSRLQAIGLMARQTTLPSDDWDKLLAENPCSEWYEYGHMELVYMNRSYLSTKLHNVERKGGYSFW